MQTSLSLGSWQVRILDAAWLSTSPCTLLTLVNWESNRLRDKIDRCRPHINISTTNIEIEEVLEEVIEKC